jgi:pyruvate formate-lyase activating enzyme-like uncharacterized protein
MRLSEDMNMSGLKIVETPYCSLLQGNLPQGCKGCVKGEKLVLFVTGICPASCFFCPLSPEKKMKDTIWANEQELTGDKESQIGQLIAEARANKATGAGVTGGDPLARLDRTCEFMKALKKEFGKFHIHLYTPLILVNDTTMKKLHDAGLDEIRFHPSLSSEKFWGRMLIAKKYDWDIGVEIPVLPDKVKEIKKLIDYITEKNIARFLNLNELEISELTIETFEKRGYEIIGKHSYAIKGSREAAIELMRYAAKKGLRAHFCTTTLKDRVQMGNRIIRRAENVAQSFDIVDDEGILTRGAVYLEYPPSFGYKKRLASLLKEERETEERDLVQVYRWLKEQGMPDDAGAIDAHRLRVVLGAQALKEIREKLKKKFPKATCALIKEWPTSDAFIVEMERI